MGPLAGPASDLIRLVSYDPQLPAKKGWEVNHGVRGPPLVCFFAVGSLVFLRVAALNLPGRTPVNL